VRGGFRGAAGVAVPGGAGKGRLIAVSQERLGEDAAGSVGEIGVLDGPGGAEPGGVRGDQRGGLTVAE